MTLRAEIKKKEILVLIHLPSVFICVHLWLKMGLSVFVFKSAAV